jgi:hypothetical protein
VAHQISADEYRALFGLRAGTGLVGPVLRARLQQLAVEHLAPYADQLKTVRKQAPRGYHWRLESRLDPSNHAAWETLAQHQRERLLRNLERIHRARREAATVRCVICDTPFVNPNQGRKARVCSEACDRERRRRLLLATPISARPGVRNTMAQATRAVGTGSRAPDRSRPRSRLAGRQVCRGGRTPADARPRCLRGPAGA